MNEHRSMHCRQCQQTIWTNRYEKKDYGLGIGFYSWCETCKHPYRSIW